MAIRCFAGSRAVVLAIELALGACTSYAPRPEPTATPRPATDTAAIPRGDTPATARVEPEDNTRKPGGYYLDDGPHANPPANLDQVADAQPKVEAIKASTARPYTAFGRTYVPMSKLEPYSARGKASWYGKRYHGQATSSGEPYDMFAMTAAHPTLPIPSYARVTNLRNGKSVVVKINDRGPFRGERIIDLSYTAAYKLGIIHAGSDLVEVTSIVPGEASSVRAVSAPATAPKPAAAGTDASPSLQKVAAREAQGVYVQLGAFSQRPNAESFLARMRAQLSWLSNSIDLYERDGVYRVHAGPYPDAQEADRVATRIEQSQDLRPVVITQ